MKKINFFEHDIKNNLNDFKKALNSLFLAYGPLTKKTENIIAKNFNKKYCILTNSWTNGALSILLSLNLKKDDEIIVPANTFVACANIVEIIGCKLVLADIDERTKLLCINDTIKKITKKTRLIMPVHIYGNVFRTDILKNKIRKNILILEDCAHCFNGFYDNKIIGSLSDFAVFSFYATKNITTGEGGGIILNNKKYYERIRVLSNNGMDKSALKRFEDKKFHHWDVSKIGIKGSMSDIKASLLVNQIKKYNKKLKIRKKVFEKFYNQLSNIKEINLPITNNNVERDYHLFPIGVDKRIRDKLIFFLNKNKIPVTVNFRSLTRLKYYKKKYQYKCKNSEEWGDSTISLPFHLNLNTEQINYICKKIILFFTRINKE